MAPDSTRPAEAPNAQTSLTPSALKKAVGDELARRTLLLAMHDLQIDFRRDESLTWFLRITNTASGCEATEAVGSFDDLSRARIEALAYTVSALVERSRCGVLSPEVEVAPSRTEPRVASWVRPVGGVYAASSALAFGSFWLTDDPLLPASFSSAPSATLYAGLGVGFAGGMSTLFVPERAARVFGNPVRRGFVGVGNMARMDPLGFEMRAQKVLVIGGSQGAKVLNELVPEALARAGAAARNLEIVHQTGHAMCESVRAHYERLGLHATVTPFIDDMARRYAEADVVVCRAGAITVAELSAGGVASILVPFPFAVDDHQTANARFLADQGAAILLPQTGLSPEALAATLRALDWPRLLDMASKARALGKPEAARLVAARCMELAG